VKGGIWTLEVIQKVCTKLMNPGQHMKGIVQEPLITCIDVNRYMLPMHDAYNDGYQKYFFGPLS